MAIAGSGQPQHQSHPSVERVRRALETASHPTDITWLQDSARTAAEAAEALGVHVGQIASSIVFTLPLRSHVPGESAIASRPLLVVTSGRHRVDTQIVEELLEHPIARADADFVRSWSGFAIGGVAPVGWLPDSAILGPQEPPGELLVLIDLALRDYGTLWAAAGHPHAVFPTTFDALVSLTGGRPAFIGN